MSGKAFQGKKFVSDGGIFFYLSSLLKGPNKLKRMSLASLFSLVSNAGAYLSISIDSVTYPQKLDLTVKVFQGQTLQLISTPRQ